MPSTHHTAMGLSSPSNEIFLVALVLASVSYLRGWRRLRAISESTIPAWRGAGFVFGMFSVWAALGSPLVGYDHDLLTVHMIQHLLLMTFAPALILLGEPQLAFWSGLPPRGKTVLGSFFRRPFVQRLGRTLSQPVLCWIVSAATLIGWHVPTLFALGMHSEVWHWVEQASFLVAGFLFWWPVIQPWPSVAPGATMVVSSISFSCHIAVRHSLRISCVF